MHTLQSTLGQTVLGLARSCSDVTCLLHPEGGGGGAYFTYNTPAGRTTSAAPLCYSSYEYCVCQLQSMHIMHNEAQQHSTSTTVCIVRVHTYAPIQVGIIRRSLSRIIQGGPATATTTTTTTVRVLLLLAMHSSYEPSQYLHACSQSVLQYTTRLVLCIQ